MSGSPRMQPTRRALLRRAAGALGSAALLGGLAPRALAAPLAASRGGAVLPAPHWTPRARRVVYLFQSGGPSQMDLFDHKPLLAELNGTELPDSVRRGQRLTGMSGNQSSLPVAGAQFAFARHGQCGAWVSELLPHTAQIVDKLCFIRSMTTEAINHDPAVTYLLTGSEIAGRPSLGAWLSWGLGGTNPDLPAFCVLVSKDKGGQPLYARLWGAGFLPSSHQGVQLRAGRDPVLYLTDPAGLPRELRRRTLLALDRLHELQLAREGDPEIDTRRAHGQLAYRLQTSIPQVTDLSDEPESTFRLYGEDARNPGTYAANCLLARRLLERDVRFVQLFHRGWDQHDSLPKNIRVQCRETDQASAALVVDLERRGLLEDTLVVWGGEFGRTSYSQGPLTDTNYGRDHHPRCFTVWLAGAGVRPGYTHGETDDFSYNIVADPVHVHDFNATLLHLLGIDHERLTYKYQGRHFRITDVHGEVVRSILA